MSTVYISIFIFSFFHQCISLSKIFLPPWLDLFQGIVLEVETFEYSNLSSKVFLAADSLLFITLNIPCQSLLACRVSAEKSADSLLGSTVHNVSSDHVWV